MARFYPWTAVSFVFFLSACQNVKVDNSDDLLTKREQKYKDLGQLFGEDTLVFGGDRSESKAGEVGIGVNSFLWRASLDTLSFMPLQSVDPFGGVILTNWYTSPQSPHERLKVDVLILSRQLRADGLKVSVFQQHLVQGQWVDQPLQAEISQQLEDLILTRARQLKIRSGK